MTTKLNDSNRRTHAAKVLAASSKRNEDKKIKEPRDEESLLRRTFENDKSLNNQVTIIRKDILKLREDLAYGYDLLKEKVSKRVKNRTEAKAS